MTRFEQHIKELTKRALAYYRDNYGRELDSTKQFYVYAILDPRKPGPYKVKLKGKTVNLPYEPFYIGKGKGTRMHAHVGRLKQGRDDGNRHKANKIRKLWREGLEPVVLQVTDLISEAEALVKEHLLIMSIGRAELKEGPLTNLSNGGEGPTGNVHSKELREAVSRRHKGKTVSAETRRLISEANKGKRHPPEVLARISASRRANPPTEAALKAWAESARRIHKGSTWSPERRAKYEETIAKRGPIQFSEEARAKMRGPKSEEARRNMSIAGRNRPPISEETRAKLSLASRTRKRRRWTDEEKQRHSELKKAQHANKQAEANKATKAKPTKKTSAAQKAR